MKYELQRKQGMQESQTEEQEMRQQQRMKVMTDVTKKIKSKGRMDATDSWWVSQLLAADCKKSVAPPMMDTVRRWYDRLYEMKKKDEEKARQDPYGAVYNAN